MKNIVILLLMVVLCNGVLAEDIIEQEIQNDSSYLSANFQKKPAQEEGKQLITNHKSFLVLNIIINGKNKQNNTAEKP
jgi:hypothetical protein